MLAGLGLCTISMALFAAAILYLEKLTVGPHKSGTEVCTS